MARQATAKKADRKPEHRFVLGRASHDCPAPAMLTTRNPPFTIKEAEMAQAIERSSGIETTIYELTPVKPGAGKKGGRRGR